MQETRVEGQSPRQQMEAAIAQPKHQNSNLIEPSEETHGSR